MNGSDYSTFLFRCLPVEDLSNKQTTSNTTAIVAGQFLRYLWVIFVGCGFALLLSILWIVLMIVSAKLVVWASLIIGLGVTAICGLAMLIAGITLMRRKDLEDLPTALLIGGIVVCVIAAVICACMYCFRDRIALVVETARESGKVLRKMPLLPCVSCVNAALQMLVFGIIALFYVFIVGTADVDTTGGTRSIHICFFAWVIMILAVFAFMWLIYFIRSFTQTVIAGAAASHYFCYNPDTELSHPIAASWSRTLCAHSGSVAMGSGLIALVGWLRSLVEASRDSERDSDNCCMKACTACCDCVLEYLQRLLEFISYRALIMVSIKGDGFWVSGKSVMFLLLRNIVRAIVLENVLPFVLDLGELLVIGISTLISCVLVRPDWFHIGKTSMFYPSTGSSILIVVLTFILCLFITSLMFDTFKITIDTTFISFLCDEEMSEGNTAYQPFGTPALREHMRAVRVKGELMNEEHERRRRERGLHEFERMDGAVPPPMINPGPGVGYPMQPQHTIGPYGQQNAF